MADTTLTPPDSKFQSAFEVVCREGYCNAHHLAEKMWQAARAAKQVEPIASNSRELETASTVPPIQERAGSNALKDFLETARVAGVTHLDLAHLCANATAPADTVTMTRDQLSSYVKQRIFDERVEAAISDTATPADEWRAAVMDACANSHVPLHDNNARKTIQDLIAINAEMALDPRISHAAQQLIEQGKALATTATPTVTCQLYGHKVIGCAECNNNALQPVAPAEPTTEDKYRQTLEIIAVGDSDNPVADAGSILVECGFWDTPLQPVAPGVKNSFTTAAPTAQRKDSGIPDGYALLPRKVTEEMHVAAVRAINRATGNADFPQMVLSAMIKTAPKIGASTQTVAPTDNLLPKT